MIEKVYKPSNFKCNIILSETCRIEQQMIGIVLLTKFVYAGFEVFTMCSFEDLAVLGCRAVSLGNQCLHREGSGDLTALLRNLDP